MQKPQSHRKSTRLKNYDYTQPGMIFITVCTFNREPLFGVIKDQVMIPNQFGEIVSTVWMEIPNHFPNVEFDAFVVMPNHIHGIISIVESHPVGARPENEFNVGNTHPVGARHASPLPQNSSPQPTTSHPNGPKPGSLGAIVGSFKSAVSKQINLILHTPGNPVWQRNYYDHIIRTEKELEQIRAYIYFNPTNWETDQLQPSYK